MQEANGFDSKIVHNKAEGYGAPFVPPQAGSVLTLVVTFFVKMLG